MENENIEKEVLDKDNIEETPKKETKKKSTTKLKITTKEYTDEELLNLIRNKYKNHNQYFKVLKNIVDQICQKELKQLNDAMNELEKIILNKSNLEIKELEKYVIQIPIYMYKLNTILSEQGLNMEISNHLNSYEVTEELLNLSGGSATERLKVAEYKTMISTFTCLVKNRVYFNIKNSLDYATKVYDGLKKALSAQIEEIKVFGKDNYK